MDSIDKFLKANDEAEGRSPATLGAALATSLRHILSANAAGRCYACGWSLGNCMPFNCAMRYKDDTAHLAEKEKWHERAKAMADVFICFTSASSPFVVSETRASTDIAMCPTCEKEWSRSATRRILPLRRDLIEKQSNYLQAYFDGNGMPEDMDWTDIKTVLDWALTLEAQ